MDLIVVPFPWHFPLCVFMRQASMLKQKADGQASRITGLEKDIRMTNERVRAPPH